MRVVFPSDLKALGGAGLSTSRLATALAADGVEVARLFKNPEKTPHLADHVRASRYIGPARPLKIPINGTRRLAPRLAHFAAECISGRMLRQTPAADKFDLLHIHELRLDASRPRVDRSGDSDGMDSLARIGANCRDYAQLNSRMAAHAKRHTEIYRLLIQNR